MAESFTEAHAEQMVIDACVAAGWKYIPAEELPRDYGDVLVDQKVKEALIRLNHAVDTDDEFR